MALERLKKRPDFIRVSHGNKWVTPTLILQTHQRDTHSTPRLGFTVTKKLGNAVIRNRIKRRLKGVADEVLEQKCKPGHDYVIVGRKAALSAEHAHILRDMLMASQKIHGMAPNLR